MKRGRSANIEIKKRRGRPPGSKDKKPRVKRQRFKRTKAEIAAGMTINQAIKAREEGIKKPEFRCTKEEKIAEQTEALLQRIRESAEKGDLDDLTRWELLNFSTTPRVKVQKVRKEESCGVKIFAAAVTVDGHARIKMHRKKPPDLAPCEKELFRIIYEQDGIPTTSVFKTVRNIMGAIYYFAHLKSLE